MSPPVFDHALMKQLCQELQERLANYQVIDCFPPNLRRFFLILQGSHREALFFCFSPPFLRFHLMSTLPQRESSSHPLSTFLKGAYFETAIVLPQERILQLQFHTAQGQRLFIAEFFPKHPNYYLIKPDRTLLFALHPVKGSHYSPPPSRLPCIFTDIARWSSHQEVEKAYELMEKQWEFNRAKRTLQAQLIKQIHKIEAKKRETEKALNACLQWEQIQHEADLMKFHFALLKKGLSSLVVHDWLTDAPYLLKLDPTKTPQEEMAARFQKAKKRRAGIQPLTQYLEKLQKTLLQLEGQKHQLGLIENLDGIDAFKAQLSLPIAKSSQTSRAALSPIFREYQSASGLKIWVGKNAKANDRLTFALANGRDGWLHAKGYPGSHVIIRLARDQMPDEETLKDAMQLALHYSKARGQGKGEVCFTQRKYVSKLKKGKAGAVQISKHRTVWVDFDPLRYRALQARSKPLDGSC